MELNRGKILVVRGGAIGDFIVTLPVLAALRQHFPQARLEVLGYSHIAQLALAGGLADAVRSIEAGALAGFFAFDGALDAALQEYFAGFAIIISYLYDPDQIFRSNIARCSRAQFIAGPHRPDEKAGLHATQVLLRPLERLAIFAPDPIPRLSVAQTFLSAGSGDFPVPGASRNTVLESTVNPQTGMSALPASYTPTPSQPDVRPTLAVHPGSGSERKNWPEAKWAELLQQLARQTAMDLLLVGGEAEGQRLSRLQAALPTSRIQWARNLPLAELAQRLATCAAFIGHDSGITHLAAAVGLPALVLWGDSTEAVWRPQAEKLIVLKDARGLQEISVARVLDQLPRLLDQFIPGTL